ncbi:MAG: molybdate ABC transporter permease subunit [Desulfobacterales bacterium]|nr:molybdate ABC transporter permease subunit [Desulfobacterales bacterium]
MDMTALYLSGKLALVSTVLLLVLAAPLTYFLVYVRLPGKFLLEALVGLPLVLPPTVLGFYLLTVLGPQGPVGRFWAAMTGNGLLFTFAGIAVAVMAHSLPYTVQPLKTAFEKIDPRLLETAAVLGLSRIAIFRRVILPNALGGLVAAAVLTFAHIMGEFGVVLMVGGSIPGKTRVASIAIYEYVEALRYQEAWQLSLALLVISYFVLLIVMYLNRGSVAHGT